MQSVTNSNIRFGLKKKFRPYSVRLIVGYLSPPPLPKRWWRYHSTLPRNGGAGNSTKTYGVIVKQTWAEVELKRDLES